MLFNCNNSTYNYLLFPSKSHNQLSRNSYKVLYSLFSQQQAAMQSTHLIELNEIIYYRIFIVNNLFYTWEQQSQPQYCDTLNKSRIKFGHVFPICLYTYICLHVKKKLITFNRRYNKKSLARDFYVYYSKQLLDYFLKVNCALGSTT